MSRKRFKTNYPGVFYREVPRAGGNGTEKSYYVIFKRDGKVLEEKAGRQHADNMTPAKAAKIRAARIEGRRESRQEVRQRRERERQTEPWTIDRLWEEYSGSRSLKGIVQDKNRFEKHLAETVGDKQPKQITPLEFDKLRQELEAKGLAAASVHHVMELLRRLINYASKRGLCPTPSYLGEMPRVNNVRTEDLTPEQIGRLWNALEEAEDQQVAAMMKLALLTGMRRGEILRLEWQDVNSERGFIILRDPKGGLNETIPLNEQVWRIIAKQPRTSSYVFPGRNGGQRVDVRRQANRIKEAADLPKEFRPFHGLRHVFASMLASSGQVDLYILQRLLTHKSPQPTQRYAHLRDEALRRGSELASDLISGVLPDQKRIG